MLILTADYSRRVFMPFLRFHVLLLLLLLHKTQCSP